MRVYISGPITKDKGYYQKFLNAEHKLKEAGCEVINPARIGKILPKSFEVRRSLKQVTVKESYTYDARKRDNRK